MPQEKLAQQLESLHQTLQQQEVMDDKAKSLLKQISLDIEKLNQNYIQNDTDTAIDTIEQSLVHFEQEHPTIAGILREAVDLLNKMGI